MFAGKKSAQIREILISESAWEEMTCLFAPSLGEVIFQALSVSRIYKVFFPGASSLTRGFALPLGCGEHCWLDHIRGQNLTYRSFCLCGSQGNQNCAITTLVFPSVSPRSRSLMRPLGFLTQPSGSYTKQISISQSGCAR